MKIILSALAMFTVIGLAGCGQSHPHSAAPVAGLSSPPTGVHWMDYQGISIPLADQGPRKYSSTAADGFADDPCGAALAAIVHTVRMSVAPDGTWAHVAADEIADSPGKDSWVASRELFSIVRPASNSTAPRIVGYRVTDFRAAERAAVTVYSRLPDNSLSAVRTQVRWVGGDWRLELPDPRSARITTEVVTEIPSDTVRLEKR